MDSGGTKTYRRDGVDVTAPVLSDGVSTFTPAISVRSAGASKFLHGDRVGTFAHETDANQNTTATKQYDAFGNLTSSTGSSLSPFGFAGGWGYQEDQDSGLKLLGHRYYDPSTGRFLTRDPAKDGRNWYAYCSSRPTACADPQGLQLSLNSPTGAWAMAWAMNPLDDPIIPAVITPASIKFWTLFALLCAPLAALLDIVDSASKRDPENPHPLIPVWRLGNRDGHWWSTSSPLGDPDYLRHQGMSRTDNPSTVIQEGNVLLEDVCTTWFPFPSTGYDFVPLGNGYTQVFIPDPGSTVQNPVTYPVPPHLFR